MIEPLIVRTGAPSCSARQRMLSRRGEPLFLADWADVLMVHLEVEPAALQHDTPFPLDRFDGRAFVSLVFFTLRRMRPRWGGRIAEWLLRPVASHEFFNVRTYVQCDGEPGICFLAEWLPNAFSVRLGPRFFGLPYRLGRIHYQNNVDNDRVLEGQIIDPRTNAKLTYRGQLAANDAFVPCPAGSLEEWLMERYTAFTHRGAASRFFRVWHRPWLQRSAAIELGGISIVSSIWPWFSAAVPTGANYSPGLRDVWMGRPHRLREASDADSGRGPFSFGGRHLRERRDPAHAGRYRGGVTRFVASGAKTF